MAKIVVLQVHKSFDRLSIQDYELADFEGKRREKTLRQIYGCKAAAAARHILVRTVPSRVAPPYGQVWYKMPEGDKSKKLYFYKDDECGCQG